MNNFLEIVAAFGLLFLALFIVFVFYAFLFAALFLVMISSLALLGKVGCICLWIFLLSCLLGWNIYKRYAK
jgi:hypothetical protein